MSLSRESSPFHELEHFTEWWLGPKVTDLLFDLWGTHTVDLFTARLNNKAKAFCSHLPDTHLARQAMQVDWSRGLLSMYPSLPLLSLALHKVIQEEAQVIAILMRWPQRGWFLLVCSSLLTCRCCYQRSTLNSLLLGPDGVPHPDLHKPCLAT